MERYIFFLSNGTSVGNFDAILRKLQLFSDGRMEGEKSLYSATLIYEICSVETVYYSLFLRYVTLDKLFRKKGLIVLDQRRRFLRTGLEKSLMIHKGHFELVNQKDMRSNAQKKTENISSYSKAEILYKTALDVLRINVL